VEIIGFDCHGRNNVRPGLGLELNEEPAREHAREGEPFFGD
jgi:hypothetical protein